MTLSGLPYHCGRCIYGQRPLPSALPLQDTGLELQYKTCYARILDSKRRFLEAALRYYEPMWLIPP